MSSAAAAAAAAAAGAAGRPLVQIAPPPGMPRVPDGQRVAQNWPVLHHGEVPSEDPARWTLRLHGAVARPVALPLPDLMRHLRTVEVCADVHCVTGWSLLESTWTGVPFAEIERLAAPAPGATHLMAHAAGGWSTNLPLEDCRRPGVALVWARNGDPLTPAHGGPLRLLVPHLYFWKSCKWLVGLEWMTEDRPGFWERDTIYKDLDPWHGLTRAGA